MKQDDQQEIKTDTRNTESKPSILELKKNKQKSNYFSGNASDGKFGKANSSAMSSQKSHRIKRGSN